MTRAIRHFARQVLRRQVFAAGLLLSIMLTIAACGGTGVPPNSRHVTIEMLDNSFDRPEIRIPVGGEVTFIGAGRNPHNAVASDGSWSTETMFGSLQQMEGDAATLHFDQPGEYLYFCTLHGNAEGGGMAARLLVGDVNASAAAQGIAESTAPSLWSGVTIRVPEEHPTIQEAVNAAGPGDLVLVGPGIYREAVEITHRGLSCGAPTAMRWLSTPDSTQKMSFGFMPMEWRSRT